MQRNFHIILNDDEILSGVVCVCIWIACISPRRTNKMSLDKRKVSKCPLKQKVTRLTYLLSSDLLCEIHLARGNQTDHYHYKCTKHQFIHLLTVTCNDWHIENSKIIKRWHHSPSHRLTVNVLLNNITFYDFAVFDVSVIVRRR